MGQDLIRNFAIIAHIDHGKSTLADRLMEMTGTVARRQMREQLLDSNPIERERGITIKLAPVRMTYRRKQVLSSNFQFLNKSQDQNKLEIRNSKLEISSSEFILNLIDTPGHVDFSYEVSRSLAACEGALLVVDATQGVQAQTLANLAKAREQRLTIIPIINKIDLPNARIEETEQEMYDLGFRNEEIIQISAKTGENVEEVLGAIVERIPGPRGEPDKPLRALVFSSQYDSHKGVVVFVRVVDGLIGGAEVGTNRAASLANENFDPSSEKLVSKSSGFRSPKSEAGQNFVGSTQPSTARSVPLRAARLRFVASGAQVTPIEIGYFSPKMIPCDTLRTGEVGYIATGLKDIRVAKVGDTITFGDASMRQRVHASTQNIDANDAMTPAVTPLAGYKEPKPMVFVGLFPVNSDDITEAREAMERLRLSDGAFSFRPIASLALGHGFHCGFLGLLHAEIVQERLVREFGITMIATAPSVEYRVRLRTSVIPAKAGIQRSAGIPDQVGDDNIVSIQSASEFPDPSLIEEVREPVMNVVIFSPKRYVGAIMQLCQEKRGEYIDLKYEGGQAEFTYLIPLSEMIIDFFDRLKSITEGYASLDYEFFEYQFVKLVKLDLLVNKEKVDALSFLSVEEAARHRAITIVERLAEVIPRHQFPIPIQAAIGGNIIARADVKSFRKDVTQKLYGGDRTRKDKLLEAQKKGKAKMKMIGRVEIPQSAFFEVLKKS